MISMKSGKAVKAAAVVFGIVLLLGPVVAFAQPGTGNPGGGGLPPGTGNPPPSGGGPGGGSGGGVITFPNPLSCKYFDCLVDRIIDGLLILGAPIVTLMIIIGAFQIIGAAGEPEKLKRGWHTVLGAGGGYLVLLFAKGIHLIIQSIF